MGRRGKGKSGEERERYEWGGEGGVRLVFGGVGCVEGVCAYGMDQQSCECVCIRVCVLCGYVCFLIL